LSSFRLSTMADAQGEKVERAAAVATAATKTDPQSEAGRAPMPETSDPALKSALAKPSDHTSLPEDKLRTLAQMRGAVLEQGAMKEDVDDPSLLRFLKARDWNIKKASKLFVDHLVGCTKSCMSIFGGLHRSTVAGSILLLMVV
jgi:hypothetical protein